jgi:hypothetical protein
MKVWIVFEEILYEADLVIGVYATEEAAQEAIDHQKYGAYWTDEYDVQVGTKGTKEA